MNSILHDTQGLPANLDRESLLSRITHRILQAQDLQEILEATAAEVRFFLGIDRTTIYKFYSDGSGQVVAESIHEDRLPSLLCLNFPADDIPQWAREWFVKGRMRSLVDVERGKIGHSILDRSSGDSFAFEPIRYRTLDPCHAQYLTAMGVQFSLVVPILEGEQLWGLLASHHSESHTISEQELQGVQRVVDLIAVAVSQATLLDRAREQAHREATINCVSTLLHSLSEIELQTALTETVTRLHSSGGRLYLFGKENFELYTWGKQPQRCQPEGIENIEEHPVWQAMLKNGDRPVWAISDLYRAPELHSLQSAFQPTSIRGLLVVPLRYRNSFFGYLTIFRDEIETETLWAGQFDRNRNQERPRSSFAAWRERKKEQASPWTEAELELVQVLGHQFALAIAQYEMHASLQALNANLEQQVQARTKELQQTLSDLQATQTQLIQTEKMSSLGQLVAGIAHEINNPVNFIYGNLAHTRDYAEELLDLLALYQQHCPCSNPILLQRLDDIDLDFLRTDLPKTLKSMNVGAERIRQIVLSLKNFSRLDEAEKKPVDLHEGLDNTLLILQHRLKAKPDSAGIEIIKEYGDLPLVECYAGQINQVFMNLLSNAIDAIEEFRPLSLETDRGKIRICTEVLPNNRVSIRIADNGAGISQALQARIFEPFFTTKPAGRGTGLGLSICYQIVVDKHQGQFRLESQHGLGTEFQLEIPMQQ